MDFSGNYAFVTHDAAQGFHCDNSQLTVHVFVTYFKNTDKNLETRSFRDK